MIAISRCEDYRHDVYDVTTGSLLGLLVAYFTYRRYYPPLRHSKCATPYPNPADSINGFSKVKDEEERIRSAGEFELDEFDEHEEEESRPLNSRR
jgi:diacylglycerol diphosphate phosphatase / phosphatidate phosphatase